MNTSILGTALTTLLGVKEPYDSAKAKYNELLRTRPPELEAARLDYRAKQVAYERAVEEFGRVLAELRYDCMLELEVDGLGDLERKTVLALIAEYHFDHLRQPLSKSSQFVDLVVRFRDLSGMRSWLPELRRIVMANSADTYGAALDHASTVHGRGWKLALRRFNFLMSGKEGKEEDVLAQIVKLTQREYDAITELLSDAITNLRDRGSLESTLEQIGPDLTQVVLDAIQRCGLAPVRQLQTQTKPRAIGTGAGAESATEAETDVDADTGTDQGTSLSRRAAQYN